MAYTKESKKSILTYKAESVKRVPLDMKNEDYDRLKVVAEANGETVNGYIKEAIRQRMERELTEGAGDIFHTPRKPRKDSKKGLSNLPDTTPKSDTE